MFNQYVRVESWDVNKIDRVMNHFSRDILGNQGFRSGGIYISVHHNGMNLYYRVDIPKKWIQASQTTNFLEELMAGEDE